MILGHEASGTVVAVGTEVKNLKPGDRIALEPGIPRWDSAHTQNGLYNLDPELTFLATPPVHGCMSTTIIHPAALCFKLPDNVSYEEGAMCEPIAVGMHSATKAGIKPGDVGLVIGCGTIGIVTALSALAGGCSEVLVCIMSLISLLSQLSRSGTPTEAMTYTRQHGGHRDVHKISTTVQRCHRKGARTGEAATTATPSVTRLCGFNTARRRSDIVLQLVIGGVERNPGPPRREASSTGSEGPSAGTGPAAHPIVGHVSDTPATVGRTSGRTQQSSQPPATHRPPARRGTVRADPASAQVATPNPSRASPRSAAPSLGPRRWTRGILSSDPNGAPTHVAGATSSLLPFPYPSHAQWKYVRRSPAAIPPTPRSDANAEDPLPSPGTNHRDSLPRTTPQGAPIPRRIPRVTPLDAVGIPTVLTYADRFQTLMADTFPLPAIVEPFTAIRRLMTSTESHLARLEALLSQALRTQQTIVRAAIRAVFVMDAYDLPFTQLFLCQLPGCPYFRLCSQHILEHVRIDHPKHAHLLAASLAPAPASTTLRQLHEAAQAAEARMLQALIDNMQLDQSPGSTPREVSATATTPAVSGAVTTEEEHHANQAVPLSFGEQSDPAAPPLPPPSTTTAARSQRAPRLSAATLRRRQFRSRASRSRPASMQRPRPSSKAARKAAYVPRRTRISKTATQKRIRSLTKAAQDLYLLFHPKQ
ncbi:Alcohol dehydrogenase GroES-like domain containing protein [Novymonas esmeraldas]|uniref:Alcohol dehydrogenase GroES-like domain containing protein n=1 Tax=Novymonas esmeraldas TaxID=1808958 RepID=A0AAW0F278_9TRYP